MSYVVKRPDLPLDRSMAPKRPFQTSNERWQGRVPPWKGRVALRAQGRLSFRAQDLRGTLRVSIRAKGWSTHGKERWGRSSQRRERWRRRWRGEATATHVETKASLGESSKPQFASTNSTTGMTTLKKLGLNETFHMHYKSD